MFDMDVVWTETIGLYNKTSTVKIPVACTVAWYAVCHGLWLKYCTCIDTEMACVLCFHKCTTYYNTHKILNKPKVFIIKPTRCNNFSNLFLEWNYTCFGQFLCPSIIWSFSLYTQQWYMSPRFADSWHTIPLLCVQWKTPDDGQRNCLKHVQFHSKNKFEKLVHLVGFNIRNQKY